MTKRTVEIESVESAVKAIAENEAVLLYFYSDHCAPCISLRPKVEKMLEQSFPNMKLYYVNSVKYAEVAAHFHSFSNPTLILFFDGKEHRRLSKYIGTGQLSDEIERPYRMIFG